MPPLTQLCAPLSAPLMLLCVTFILSCSVGEADSGVLRDPDAAQAGKASLEWMKRRVDLMVKHKADCLKMAEMLLEDDRQSEAQRADWRAVGAQRWLIARSASDFEFQKELSEVITRGDLVFSFCAFFEDFRMRLKP